MIVAHATRVDIDGAAVLLRGPFAAGKYDLALRMIDAGAKLVADDQMQLVAVRGELIASAPAQLSEKMEVCGLGIFDLGDSQLLPRARVALVADLGPSADVARLPHRTAPHVLSARRYRCSARRVGDLRVLGTGENPKGVESLERGGSTSACTKRCLT